MHELNATNIQMPHSWYTSVPHIQVGPCPSRCRGTPPPWAFQQQLLLQVAFVSNTEMLSVEPSIHDLTLLPAPGGTASYRITGFMLLGLSGTFITSFFKNKCLYSCLAC